MTFDQWFSTIEWWHESTAYDTMGDVWTAMAEAGMDADEIVTALDNIMAVMRNEYGD